jgi:CheY-like chemotaxis protein
MAHGLIFRREQRIQDGVAMQEQVKVYVVDDEPVIASTLAAILNSSGFRAMAFTGPSEALQAAEAGGPALLISDVVMPGMSGIDLAIRLKAICPACKILLFSGQAATADLLEAAGRQGHNFTVLSKPVHPKDLLVAIQRL